MSSARWYYGPADAWRGPFDKAEIRALIEGKAIQPETLLWRETTERYKKHHLVCIKKVSYHAIKTQFGVYFPPQALTAAAAGAKVSDRWLWVGAFFPPAVALVLYALYFSGWEPFALETMLVLVIALTSVAAYFTGLDLLAMIRGGYQPLLYESLCSDFFMYPLYYFLRNRRLGRSQASAWTSLTCWVLTVWMYVSFPFYTNADVGEIGGRFIDALLRSLRPEITAECVSVSVQKRLPGMKFEVAGRLSDGNEIGITLTQSGFRFRFDTDGEKIHVRMPPEIAAAFVKKVERTSAETPDR